jgi:alpha-tubulin suppressor-like RCC1 family protein
MPTTTGTYTTGLKDELGIDMGRMLIEKAYVTAVGSLLSPAYLAPIAQKSNFAFKSGVTTLNLDDVYVRNDDWREGYLLDFGFNDNGQLGDFTLNNKSSPTQVVGGGITWRDCSAGGASTAGIKSDGSLWLWGDNAAGQLGDNTITDRSSPVQTVSAGTNWWRVSCGKDHTACIKTDGTLWLWGNNGSGRLGDNSVTSRSSPVQTVSGGATWRQVSCGYRFTAAIKSDGTLWMWGLNSVGNLGDGTITPQSSPVQTISAGSNWKQVSCGAFHTAAVKTDGTLWLWGQNAQGQLGITSATAATSSPIQTVAAGTNWKSVSAGGFHTAAIKTDGTLWTFGFNNVGQLGDNSVTTRSSPVQVVSGGTNWRLVSCGYNHTGAIKNDGTLWLWGENFAGQIGDLTQTDRSSPVQTALGGTAWRKISCSNPFSFASHSVGITYADQPFGAVIPTPPVSSCWVARAVYGEDSVEWVVFRAWLLEDAPTWLRSIYLRFGEAFSKVVEKSGLLRRALKNLMDRAIKRKTLPDGSARAQLQEYKDFIKSRSS